MIEFSLEEAQLYNILMGFFGREHVVPRMSVISVCGGDLPEAVLMRCANEDDQDQLFLWARNNRCLFTIVDSQDNPKMVIEFFSGFQNSVDAEQAEHQRYLRPLLHAAGVQYVTISDNEFSELVDPRSPCDFFALLKAKVEDLGVVV